MKKRLFLRLFKQKLGKVAVFPEKLIWLNLAKN
jgi:hypothetical protein